MQDKSLFDAISFIASIASLILSLGAIWLSVVFFRMSDSASKATTEAAKGIAASVERLEKLFDKLYSDTFSMMKDTVSDMRKHIWNNPQNDTSQEKSIPDQIKKEIEAKIRSSLEEIGISSEDKKRKLAENLESAVESMISKTSKFKKRFPDEIVIASIKKLQPVTMKQLSEHLNIDDDTLAIAHLFPLRLKGKITWDSAENSINSSSLIVISNKSDQPPKNNSDD